MCTHPINAIGVHLLCCAHDNEHTGTHDVIRDTFAAIARNVIFHLGQKQLHTFPSTTFHSSRQQVDIMLTKDAIRTLIDLSLSIQHKRIYFVNHAQPKDLLPLKQLKPKKRGVMTNNPLIISSLS